MKTINERAIEAYPNITAENVNEVLIARKAYIKGATEQKQIDDEQLCEMVLDNQNAMVDKACKAFCRYCSIQCENHPHDDCEILIEYKAALNNNDYEND